MTIVKRRATIGATLALAAMLGSAAHGAQTQTQRTQQPPEPDLTQRLARLERIVEGQGLVELLQQVEALQFQVQQLQGRIESQNFTLEQLRNQQREIFSHVDGRLRTVEAGGTAATPASNEPPLAAMVPNETPIVAGSPADDAFNVTVTTPDEPEFLDDPSARQQRPPTTSATGTLAPIIAGAAPPQGTLRLPAATQPAPAFQGTTQSTGATPGQTLATTPAGRSLAIVGPSSQSAAIPAPGMTGTQRVPATTARPTNTATAGQPAQIATVDTADSEKAYNDAFALLKAGQYDQAIVALRTFLAQYPASQYVDNAQYWLGESFYVLRQYEAAIAEYQKLLQLYPDSQKFSHALLKIGYSYDELGQRDLARSTLQELTDNFPSTTAARLAAERITRIRVESMR